MRCSACSNRMFATRAAASRRGCSRNGASNDAGSSRSLPATTSACCASKRRRVRNTGTRHLPNSRRRRMADSRGFMHVRRSKPIARPVAERTRDWNEVYRADRSEEVGDQASRCMDCGIPFCHNGCPLGNHIPDWNDLAYRRGWQRASERLHATNNFPEFTGRLCPAPCESSCVLGLADEPVTIRRIELSIVEHAFSEGWIQAAPPAARTGRRVTVVGSGPAGLAAADQLNRSGHQVTVYEKADRIGGLLRYGIPDFKLDKRVLDRRLALLAAEGISFRPGVEAALTCRRTRCEAASMPWCCAAVPSSRATCKCPDVSSRGSTSPSIT